MFEKRNLKFSFLGKGIFVVMFFGLVSLTFISCAGMINARTIVNNVPLEEQAQIIFYDYLIVTAEIEGVPIYINTVNNWNKVVINIPAGTHTFNCGYYVEGSTMIYRASNLKLTTTFEAGKQYLMYPMWETQRTVFVVQNGYAEWYQPNQDETLIVIRRRNGLGDAGEANIFIDGKKAEIRTWAGHTHSILLKRGEHKLEMNNVGGPNISINAGGGTKRFFEYGRILKEVRK